MPQDPAAALGSLLRASTIQDHEEILHAANAAIKANKNDVVSHHIKVVALLNINRFDDALRVLAAGGPKLQADCALERAYAFYKIGSLDEAVSVLDAAGSKHRGFSHVAAQVDYRAERFNKARDAYQELLASDPSGEETDLNINIKATTAQSLWQGSAVRTETLVERPPDNFMLCYNAACAAIARGALETAASLLQRASRLCDASDDLTVEEKQVEMRPILAQQAYVYARMGKTKDALDLVQALGTTDDSDPDFVVVSENNRVAIQEKPANPYLLQRKASTWLDAGQNAKLFNYQSMALARNISVIDLQAQKLHGVKARTERLLGRAEHPSTKGDVNSLSVLNAAAATRGATGRQMVDILNGLSEKRPDDVGLALSLIQIQLQRGRQGAALSSLESFLHRLDHSEAAGAKDVRFIPGLIALAVTLMRSRGHMSAKAELVKAAQHWKGRASSSAAPVLAAAGVELIKSSRQDDLSLAGAAFETLFDQDPGSGVASAGLVAAHAASDPAKIQQHIAKLPPVDTLIQGLDIESLIAGGVAAAPQPLQSRKRPAPEYTAATTGGTGRATKRRRKRKLPKNCEEGKAPDPERWLPLRDRSSYRPKGKKGKKKAAESTQGGVVKEETLELVGGGGVKVERAHGGGSSSKNKKKKGKK